MSETSRAADIENLVDGLIEFYLAQAADRREYAKAMTAGDGTVHLRRTLRIREFQRADLHRRFELAALTAPQAPGLADQI